MYADVIICLDYDLWFRLVNSSISALMERAQVACCDSSIGVVFTEPLLEYLQSSFIAHPGLLQVAQGVQHQSGIVDFRREGQIWIDGLQQLTRDLGDGLRSTDQHQMQTPLIEKHR